MSASAPATSAGEQRRVYQQIVSWLVMVSARGERIISDCVIYVVFSFFLLLCRSRVAVLN